MNSALEAALRNERRQRESRGLLRTLRWIERVDGPRVVIDGRELINFSSNDYLGLAQHPRLKSAAVEAAEKFGAGAGASRLICGSLPIHRKLEEEIARFKQTENALSFSSGYAAAVGAICSLVNSRDIIVIDKLAHASLIDGARLSGAKLRVFKHNNLQDLEAKLLWTQKIPDPRILIITESIFSMDGDCAPLREIVELKEKFGAWLMLDEAHALGVIGPNRRGLAEELGVADRVEIQMGTLGKAVGAAGGFIAGSETLIDHLINSARSFIFSTAPTPSAAAAARAGLEVVRSPEGETLQKKLSSNLRQFGASRQSLPSATTSLQPAIIPVIIGDETVAIETSEKLRAAGFLVPAIRYPTVARGQARLRITLSALHTQEQIDALGKTLLRLLPSR